MELILIAAQARNRVIGKQGELPWHISEDLKRFKQLTLNHPVIMGRKTYEAIVKRLGKPLPNRTNIVLTKQHKEQQGVFFCST
ncbi:MAG: dihydrofolate reductase, partial [Nanoarchaeota archaeon]